MAHFYLIAPAVIPAAYIISMFVYFALRYAMGYRPDIDGVDRRKATGLIGPLFMSFFFWLIRPIERLFVAARVSPNALTFISVLLCAGSGLCAALGNLPGALWMYIGAGALDSLDGRLARATNRSSKAGAFLDSVSDRWGELFVFTGFAWYLRDTHWLVVVMLAIGGSMMVSYTRARGEGLGIALDGGTMQRAERILLVAIGTFVAAWVDASAGGDPSPYTKDILGIALAITGVLSTVTSLGRWTRGYKLLSSAEQTAGAQPEQEPGNLALATERSRGEISASGKHAA